MPELDSKKHKCYDGWDPFYKFIASDNINGDRRKRVY